jgi:hypothetical protein
MVFSARRALEKARLLRGFIRAGGNALTRKILTGDPAHKSYAGNLDTRPHPILGLSGNPNNSRCAGSNAAIRRIPDIRCGRDNCAKARGMMLALARLGG